MRSAGWISRASATSPRRASLHRHRSRKSFQLPRKPDPLGPRPSTIGPDPLVYSASSPLSISVCSVSLVLLGGHIACLSSLHSPLYPAPARAGDPFRSPVSSEATRQALSSSLARSAARGPDVVRSSPWDATRWYGSLGLVCQRGAFHRSLLGARELVRVAGQRGELGLDTAGRAVVVA